jgi:hypothetical protein
LSDPDAVGSTINFREPQVRFSHRAPAFVAYGVTDSIELSALNLNILIRSIE